MALIINQTILFDFTRFFYEEVSWTSDFFETTWPKIKVKDEIEWKMRHF